MVLGLEQRFGLGLLPSDFVSSRIIPRSGDHHRLPTGYHRQWAIAHQAAHDRQEKKKNLYFGKDGFQALVDVHQFKPSEVTVKVIAHTVVVEGKHEERDDGYGIVERSFVRRYTLPDDYDMKAVNSSISSDGVLTLKAPLPLDKERIIHIAHSNIPVQLCIKENKQVDEK